MKNLMALLDEITDAVETDIVKSVKNSELTGGSPHDVKEVAVTLKISRWDGRHIAIKCFYNGENWSEGEGSLVNAF